MPAEFASRQLSTRELPDGARLPYRLENRCFRRRFGATRSEIRKAIYHNAAMDGSMGAPVTGVMRRAP